MFDGGHRQAVQPAPFRRPGLPLVALGRESDSGIRFINSQNAIAKPR